MFHRKDSAGGQMIISKSGTIRKSAFMDCILLPTGKPGLAIRQSAADGPAPHLLLGPAQGHFHMLYGGTN
jgi:hypothetical protein